MSEPLTRERILAMPPGLELDELVARLVLRMRDDDIGDQMHCGILPHYSVDIAPAWIMVEILNMMVYAPSQNHGAYTHKEEWSAFAYTPMQKYGMRCGGEWAYGPTAALAICRAALLAIVIA
jgi:Phage ABA sandwich domain